MAFFVCTIFQGDFMESNERLVLRLPSDLKAMFTALCESENITVSAKIKKLMADEIQQKLNRAMFHQTQLEMMPRTQKKPPINPSDDVQATTLPQTEKTPLNAQKSDLTPLDNAFENSNGIQNFVTGEIETNKLLLGALNSAKKRQNNKKKKR